MSLIVLDPGHGGTEPAGNSSPYGARGPDGRYEKDVTLELARRIAAQLPDPVRLTRDGDYNLSLAERLERGRRWGAGAFVSIHTDGDSSRGDAIWVHERAGVESLLLAHALSAELSRGGLAAPVHQGDLAILHPNLLAPRTAACLIDASSATETPERAGGSAALDALAERIERGLSSAMERLSLRSALMATQTNPPYEAYLLHLDLCILSYQLYAQSLVWPMDPWYESSTEEDRKEWMSRVRSYPRSDKLIGTEDDKLDPIMYCYTGLDAKRAAFTRDPDKYVLYDVPGEITNRIGPAQVCLTDDYVVHRQRPEKVKTQDGLFVFEGKTGITSTCGGARSLMGFILSRLVDVRDASKGYNLHVVFRGSRSGQLQRAVQQGVNILNERKGNPDWMTDLQYATMKKGVPVEVIGSKANGSPSAGFAASLKSCLPAIRLALLRAYSYHKYEEPENISVTGHSLGGALATHFCAAVRLGTFRKRLNPEHSSWDESWDIIQNWSAWDRLKLFTYSAPPCGGKTFASKIAQTLGTGCHRIWIENDIIAQGAIKIPGAGKSTAYHPKSQDISTCIFPTTYRDPDINTEKTLSREQAHSPQYIRAYLLQRVGDRIHANSAWREFDTFQSLIRGRSDREVRSLFPPNYPEHASFFLSVLDGQEISGGPAPNTSYQSLRKYIKSNTPNPTNNAPALRELSAELPGPAKSRSRLSLMALVANNIEKIPKQQAAAAQSIESTIDSLEILQDY